MWWIIHNKALFNEHFNGNELVVPSCEDNNPHCHSAIGTKLLCIDWQRTHGMQVSCPDANCNGIPKSDRTHFSKNKTLHAVFGLDGSPTWCVVVVLVCPCCKRRFNSNESDMLTSTPEFAADVHPVETNYAFRNSECHLNRHATEAFSSIMLTYGNGELCSKLLFNATNRDCIRRIESCYSVQQEAKHATAASSSRTVNSPTGVKSASAHLCANQVEPQIKLIEAKAIQGNQPCSSLPVAAELLKQVDPESTYFQASKFDPSIAACAFSDA